MSETVYWFESNSKELTFKYNQAAPTIKKLVSNAVFAGPNETEKLTNAAKAIGDGFVVADWQGNSEEQKSYKVSYINKQFNLGNEDNFNLFKELVINQTFRNRYSKNNTDDDIKIFIPGSQLWYKSNNENVTNDELTKIAERINCSVVISISQDELKDNKKLANYQVSFRLKPKNGGNWKGLDNGNSIDIDVSFLSLNFNSIIKEDSTSSEKPSNKTGSSTPSTPKLPNLSDGESGTKIIKFDGTLKPDLLAGNDNSSAEKIAKLFSNKENQTQSTVSGTDIKTEMVKKLYDQIESNVLTNKKTSDSNSTDYTLNKQNLSFLYVDKFVDGEQPKSVLLNSESQQPTKQPSYIYSKNVNLSQIEVKENTTGKTDANSKKFNINLTFKLNTANQAKWYWGNWSEVYDANNQNIGDKETAKSDIQLSFLITVNTQSGGGSVR